VGNNGTINYIRRTGGMEADSEPMQCRQAGAGSNTIYRRNSK